MPNQATDLVDGASRGTQTPNDAFEARNDIPSTVETVNLATLEDAYNDKDDRNDDCPSKKVGSNATNQDK